MSIEKIISQLQHLVVAVPRQIQQISPEEMSHQPGAGKWSKRQILGHLCDSALHNWQRFNLSQQAEGSLQLVSYQQDVLVELNNWQQQTTGQVVALWASLNRQILAVLKNLPEENLARPILLPNGANVTLLFLAQDYLAHLEHHLAQLFLRKIDVPTLPYRWGITAGEALDLLHQHPDGQPFLRLLERGTMSVEVYQPREVDLQKPHDQDEIYVIISGSGIFWNNGERRKFRPGDLLFVPAGVVHRFEDFTEGFATWVIFY